MGIDCLTEETREILEHLDSILWKSDVVKERYDKTEETLAQELELNLRRTRKCCS